MVKNIFNCKFHLRFVLNPVIRYKADNLGNFCGTNRIKREVPVIVSLTSYEERFKDLVISIYSLLNQTIKPDRIILWLSDEYDGVNDLPYEITRFIKNGLEIRFVKDIKSYTKAIYAFKEYPEAIIVTADDDIYYPEDWLEKLYHSYITHPQDIQVHRAHRVKIIDNNFEPLFQSAMQAKGFAKGQQRNPIGVGFSEIEFNSFLDKVISTDFRKLFIIGNSNLNMKNNDYFQKLFTLLPDSCYAVSFSYNPRSENVFYANLCNNYPLISGVLQKIFEKIPLNSDKLAFFLLDNY